MKKKIFPKERVLRTYNFQEPDRIPTDFCACEEIYNALIKKLGATSQLELLEKLHIDFRWARTPYIGPELKTPEGVKTDYFGIPRKGVGDFGYSLDHPLKHLSSVKDIENYPWPSPEWFDYDVFVEECKRFAEYAVYGGGWSWFFEAAAELVGMEKFYVLLYEDPSLAYKLLEKITDFFYDVSKIMFEKAKGKVDIFFTGDDYGSQKGPLIGLEMWRKMVKPHIKRLYSLAKSYELKIMQHSCGSIADFLPDLISLGLNAIEPVQVRAVDMDIHRLTERFNGQIVFHGSIDTQKTLPFGTTQDVKNEVLDRISLFKERNGGIIIGPTQHLLPEIPIENILTLYRTTYEYGKIK